MGWGVALPFSPRGRTRLKRVVLFSARWEREGGGPEQQGVKREGVVSMMMMTKGPKKASGVYGRARAGQKRLGGGGRAREGEEGRCARVKKAPRRTRPSPPQTRGEGGGSKGAKGGRGGLAARPLARPF